MRKGYDEFMRMQEDDYYEIFTGGKLKMRWRQMHQRCENPKRKDFKYYGAKGVKVCAKWSDYRTFRKWFYYAMIEEGSYDLSVLVIDRQDPNGDYCPFNCRLIKKSENSRRAERARGSDGRFCVKGV